MVIILSKPYSVGELAEQDFPHLYITTLYVNGPNQQVTVGYEYGRMGKDNAWQTTPVSTAQTLTLTGVDLIPFFYTPPETLGDSLWNQIERLIYAQIQQKDARAAGEIGEPSYAFVPPIEPEPLLLSPVDVQPLLEPQIDTQPVQNTPVVDGSVEVIKGPSEVHGEDVPMPIAIPQADGGDV